MRCANSGQKQPPVPVALCHRKIPVEGLRSASWHKISTRVNNFFDSCALLIQTLRAAVKTFSSKECKFAGTTGVRVLSCHAVRRELLRIFLVAKTFRLSL